MSVAVSLEALHARVAEFGDHPYLITVNADGRAHVVSVSARVDDDRVLLAAGRTSRANMEANPAVTLLWAAAEGGDYALLVDGNGEMLDGGKDEVAIRPTRAVLHRISGASNDLPSCIALEEPD